MILFYQISIQLYAFGIRIASLFKPKAKLWVEGRQHLLQKIETTINNSENHVWFHCASLGEYEQAKPIIEKIKLEYPNYTILVTFFSPSGYELRKNDSLVDYAFYLPIDTISNATSFIELVNPKMVFFVKYEFWFNYILQLKARNIPTYLVSGVFRTDQLFFKWYGKWYKKVLNGFTHFFVQNEASKRLLNEHGFNNVTLSGDTRYDRVFENSLNPTELPLIAKFKENKLLMVGGSTWQPEEQILASFSNTGFKIIVAPHDISESHIKQIEHLFKNKCLRYSNATLENVLNESVLIIDNIGILSNIYQYSDVSLIGGGFSGSLHNILEPACFGNVVLFGSKHIKYHEAQELINQKGAFEINNETDFNTILDSLLENLDIYQKNSSNFVKNKIGATSKIVDYLKSN
ncbi:MAG: 3-deoxy-D-manno-octulosonic acid transferase [Flavobacteriales bacterium]|nr:3-deoxy-D-manno-octulosonic acid transferase [Flavobacteriales bacterium]MCB9173798.1 3-deoxy-D-manno-octulosonic acid transferase [Flavobacteriales bacterium]